MSKSDMVPSSMGLRNVPVGAEGGLDWVLAGGLGALLSSGDDAILLTLQAFAVSLGHDETKARQAAELWLPTYRSFLQERGVANA